MDIDTTWSRRGGERPKGGGCGRNENATMNSVMLYTEYTPVHLRKKLEPNEATKQWDAICSLWLLLGSKWGPHACCHILCHWGHPAAGHFSYPHIYRRLIFGCSYRRAEGCADREGWMQRIPRMQRLCLCPSWSYQSHLLPTRSLTPAIYLWVSSILKLAMCCISFPINLILD